MNTEPKQLGSLYLSHSYRIRKVGVNNVPHGFGWIAGTHKEGFVSVVCKLQYLHWERLGFHIPNSQACCTITLAYFGRVKILALNINNNKFL
jgi:hypothetical protein